MMSNTSMYGVVLWADAEDRKAVIWCEDQGNLAFYTPSFAAAGGEASAHDGLALDAGDLVQFDLREEENLRFARNPQLVQQSQFPGIAQKLHAGPRQADPRSLPAPKPRPGGSNVISLQSYFGGGGQTATA